MNYLLVVTIVSGFIYTTVRFPESAYYAQQGHYQLDGYIRHHLKQAIVLPDLAALVYWLVATILAFYRLPLLSVVVLMAMAVQGIIHSIAWQRRMKSYKVPFVWTARVKRLFAAYLAVWVLELTLVCLVLPQAGALPAAIPVLNLLLALIVAKPVEAQFQAGFKRRAKSRLRQLRRLHQLRVVGITGSYGKTSSKFILGAILGARYDVLVTPNSFNTPMGICKVVNGDLAAHHEVFVAEMGARHRGDIRELVAFVEPQYAMITAVGPVHLETFGSVENIAHTKFDLARGTSRDGVVVVNGDNELCVAEAARLERDVLFYGLHQNSHLAAYSKEIRVEGVETAFTLVLPGDGEVACRTRLLGKHNVLNIVGAALLARRMGLSLEDIGAGVARIEPVEHRLQLIDPGNGVLVIDDAFNSNPDGAAAALEVLGQFTEHRKWIVTPGMIELGAASAEVHRRFGQQMAEVCNRVVLIGKLNTDAMLGGLRDAGFPEEHILVAPSLKEAQGMYQREVKAGDIILFENDLADHMEG